MEIKQSAIDKLANSMRLYVEAALNFENLKNIDIEEAVNNLDRAFEAKLEAFHSLYEVTKNDFKYFDNADTALLIMLRNAIHHKNHLLFRSWNFEMLLNEGIQKNSGAEFLMVSHSVMDQAPKMNYFYKLDDFYARIDSSVGSPYLESKMNNENKVKLLAQFENEFNFSRAAKFAENNRYPSKQIYINVMPIFISAVCKAFKALKTNGIEFKGFDAKVYEEPFTNELKVDLGKFIYNPIRIQ